MKLSTAYKRVGGDDQQLLELFRSGKIQTALTYNELREGLRKNRKGLPALFAVYNSVRNVPEEVYDYLFTVPLRTLVSSYSKGVLVDEVITNLMFRVSRNPYTVLKIKNRGLQSIVLAEAGYFAVVTKREGLLEELTELQDEVHPPYADRLPILNFENIDFTRWYLEWVDYKKPSDINYLRGIYIGILSLPDKYQSIIIHLLPEYYSPEAIMSVFLQEWVQPFLAKSVVAAVFDRMSTQEFFETLSSIDDNNVNVQPEAITHYYFEFKKHSDV